MVVRYDLRRSLAPAFVLINFVGGRLLEIPILMQRFVVDPLCNTADISRHTKYIKIDCTQSFCYNLFFISTYTNDPDRINTRNIKEFNSIATASRLALSFAKNNFKKNLWDQGTLGEPRFHTYPQKIKS